MDIAIMNADNLEIDFNNLNSSENSNFKRSIN